MDDISLNLTKLFCAYNQILTIVSKDFIFEMTMSSLLLIVVSDKKMLICVVLKCMDQQMILFFNLLCNLGEPRLQN